MYVFIHVICFCLYIVIYIKAKKPYSNHFLEEAQHTKCTHSIRIIIYV